MRRGFALDERGVRVPARLAEVVDVRFGDQRVWSFTPARERSRLGRAWVPWPPALAPYLDGVADVSLVRHAGGTPLVERRVSFGTGTEPIRLVDAAGHPVALDKTGRLHRMFSHSEPSVTGAVLDAVERVLRDLREECGLDAFLSFGCLLGAVRGGRMIGHDNDADVSYLSRHTHPFDIIRENKEAEQTMRSLGWNITRMSAGDFKIWTMPEEGHRVGIDVFAGFHVDGTFYLVPSVAGDLPREALLPVGEVTLEGRRVAAPARPEELLALTYGPGWRSPDPSFRFEPPLSTVRRLNGWLRNNGKYLRHWGDFYRSRAVERVPTEPSPFAAWVAGRLEPHQRVLDVGSGNARDAVHLARLGHEVTALDAIPFARRLTRRLAARHGVRVPFAELNLNDLFSVLTSGARFARLPEPPHVYARLLLDAIDGDSRLHFYRWARMVQRRGGLTFLEFRTWKGTLRARAFPFHFRALLRVEDVVAEIEARGGTVVHQEVGTGLAPFGDEDPEVCRLVVKWSS